MATSGILRPVEVIDKEEDIKRFIDGLDAAVEAADYRSPEAADFSTAKFRDVTGDELKGFFSVTKDEV
jgi:hypothetical protein